MKLLCKCGKIATWVYMPSDNNWACCDDHVPRGCSCNIDLKEEFYRDDLSIEELDELYKHEENFKEVLDNQERQLPCCEWWYDEEGWDE